jgi:hypothetical protein
MGQAHRSVHNRYCHQPGHDLDYPSFTRNRHQAIFCIVFIRNWDLCLALWLGTKLDLGGIEHSGRNVFCSPTDASYGFLTIAVRWKPAFCSISSSVVAYFCQVSLEMPLLFGVSTTMTLGFGPSTTASFQQLFGTVTVLGTFLVQWALPP